MDTEKDEMLTRQELFDWVWQEPLPKLSKRLGIAQHRIIKICEQYEIPRPSCRHWSLVRLGAAPTRPSLPIYEHDEPISLSSGQPPTVKKGLHVYEMPNKPEALEEAISSTIEIGSTAEDQKLEVHRTSKSTQSILVTVKERLSPNPHPMVVKLRLHRQVNKSNETRNEDSQDAKNPSLVSVSKSQMDRAWRILDAIYRSWEAMGYEIRLSDGALVKNDEVVTFTLNEIYRRIDARPPGQSWSEWKYQETGMLELLRTSDPVENFRRQWCDGKIQRLETILGSFLETVLLCMDAMCLERLDRECETRQELLAMQSSKRREREEQSEREEIKQLNQMVDNWLRAEEIREYMQAVNDRIDSGMVTPQDPLAFEEWRAWVQWYADDLCPLTFAGPSPETKISAINTPIAELDLTSKTRANVAKLSVMDTDGLFKLSKREIAMQVPECSWGWSVS